MAERQSMSKARRNIAASAAILLLAAWYTLPANANQEVAASLTDETEILADSDSYSPARFLIPRAEAAIRDAFKVTQSLSDSGPDVDSAQTIATPPMAEAKSPADTTGVEDGQTEIPHFMNTRLPGVSEEDLLLYKKQMFRKDI